MLNLRWNSSMPGGTLQEQEQQTKNEASIPSTPTTIYESEVLTSKTNTPDDNTNVNITSDSSTSRGNTSIQSVQRNHNNAQQFPNINDTASTRETEKKATLGRRLLSAGTSRSVDVRGDEKKKICDRFTRCSNITSSKKCLHFLTFF